MILKTDRNRNTFITDLVAHPYVQSWTLVKSALNFVSYFYTAVISCLESFKKSEKTPSNADQKSLPITENRFFGGF